MSSVVKLHPHVVAVRDQLTAHSIANRHGPGDPPAGAGWQGAPGKSQFVPWCIVLRIGANDVRSTSLEGNWDEARPLIWIRSVGGDIDQAEKLFDDVIAAMHPLTVAGRRMVRHPELEPSITATRDPDADAPQFISGGYFRLWTVPDPTWEEPDGS